MAIRTQQHQAQGKTLKEMLARARGPRPELMARRDRAAQFFGHFPNKIDLQEVLNLKRRAEEEFECLSPEVKARFCNKPAELIKFVQDNRNYDEACKLGLISIESQKAREAALKADKEAAAKAAEGKK